VWLVLISISLRKVEAQARRLLHQRISFTLYEKRSFLFKDAAVAQAEMKLTDVGQLAELNEWLEV